jgi:hypothetical protein
MEINSAQDIEKATERIEALHEELRQATKICKTKQELALWATEIAKEADEIAQAVLDYVTKITKEEKC